MINLIRVNVPDTCQLLFVIREGIEDGLLKGTSQIIPKIEGLQDVTSFVDGFAKFLVKRTKEELSIAFFNHFVSEIEKPENKDFRQLFPSTTRDA